MNATKTQRTPEQKAKDAANARARRAAAKAAKVAAPITPPVSAAEWQSIEVDGKTVKVAANLSPSEALAASHKLIGAKAAAEVAADEAAAEAPVPKPAKAKRITRLEAKPRKDGTIRIYPRVHQYDALAAAKDWQNENAQTWKVVKGTAKRHEQKNGVAYYSAMLESQEQLAVVEALLSAEAADKR